MCKLTKKKKIIAFLIVPFSLNVHSFINPPVQNPLGGYQGERGWEVGKMDEGGQLYGDGW